MSALWDTTLASRLHPHGEVLDYVIDQVAEGRPVRVAAPAVLEIVYGYQRMAPMISAFAAGLDVATENHRRLRADRRGARRAVPGGARPGCRGRTAVGLTVRAPRISSSTLFDRSD